jgi:hypothetical protein
MHGLRTLLFARTPLSAVASRRLSRMLVAFAAVFLAFLFANLLSFAYGRDQGIYAVVGDAIVRGGAPYKDAWDFKPPAIYFIFAAAHALFGPPAWGIRVLETLCWATVAPCFAYVVARRGGDWRLGFAGGVLATYVQVRTEYWHTAQPESFGAVCLVWAFTWVSTAPLGAPPSRADFRRWAGAGALFATAGLLKPPLGGGLLLLLPVWFLERAGNLPPARRGRCFAELALAALAGAAAPVLATFAFFLAKGALPDLLDTMLYFAPQYTKLGTSPAQLPANFEKGTRELLFYFSPMLAASVLVATPLVSSKVRREIGWTSALATAFFPWVGVAVQGKFFPYHYDGCLPFVCLFAATAYAALFGLLARWRAPGLAVAAVAGLLGYGLYDWGPFINPGSRLWDRVPLRVIALLHPSRRAELNDEMTSEADVRSAENRRLVEWLRSETPAAESVYIWGFEPIVYVESYRRPASRFVYDVPQRVSWSRDSACASLSRDLAASPPSAVAVEHDDRFVDVTGDHNDSAQTLGACAWFPEWLTGGFALAWSSPKFDVYLRRRGDAAGARAADVR